MSTPVREGQGLSVSTSVPGPGGLPPWGSAELPAPPPFGFKNLLSVIGPGAILLATSVGGGEWLVGPATAVKYGTGLMGIATIAIVLQVVFNLEAIRYTLYTGEPIYTGIMRLRPGPGFWAVFYCFIGIFQMAWPALALSAAATLFSATTGRLPDGSVDAGTMHLIAWGLILLSGVLLLFGGTIERMLEYTSWFMLAYIFGFLTIVNVLFVPPAHSLETFSGFFSFAALQGELDWALLAALAATAGSGGIGNLTITNWIRDKGFGMGKQVGAIASAVGGRHTSVSPIGKIFPVTGESLLRWREWWRYVHADQVGIWGLFCFIGLFLTVNLATSVIPQGTDMQGLATGSYQAEYMARHMWPGFWYLTLLNGFWILYSTHLGNTDILVRTLTDILWVGRPELRARFKNRVALLYYLLLAAFTLWAFYAVTMAGPFTLFKALANVAGLVLTIAGVQVLIVNRTLLPRELRPPLWREALLLACTLFYGFFTVRAAMVWLG
jgi:hypothetical protein